MTEVHRHERHKPSHVTQCDRTMPPSQTSHTLIGCDGVTLVEHDQGWTAKHAIQPDGWRGWAKLSPDRQAGPATNFLLINGLKKGSERGAFQSLEAFGHRTGAEEKLPQSQFRLRGAHNDET